MAIEPIESPIRVYAKPEDLVTVARFFGDEASTKPIIKWAANAGWEAYTALDIDSNTVLILNPGTGKGAPIGDRLFAFPGQYIVKHANNTFVVRPEVNFHDEYKLLGDMA